jgi:DNA polymerase-1
MWTLYQTSRQNHRSYSYGLYANGGRNGSIESIIQTCRISRFEQKEGDKEKAFVARDENYTLVSADYSQIELRIIAALSGEENMIKAFWIMKTFINLLLQKYLMFHLEEVTREQRSMQNG